MPLTILVRRQPPGRAGVAVLGAAILFLAPMGASRLPVGSPGPAGTGSPIPPVVIEKGDFRFACDARGVSLLANPRDPFKATLMPRAGQRSGAPPVLGLALSYRTDPQGAWAEIAPREARWKASPEAGTVAYSTGGGGPLAITETYSTDGRVLDWTVEIAPRWERRPCRRPRPLPPRAGPYGREPRADLRTRIPEPPVRLRRRLVLLLRPRLGRPALPAGHRQAGDEARVLRPAAAGRAVVCSCTRPAVGPRGDARHVAAGPHRARARARASPAPGDYGFRLQWARATTSSAICLYDERPVRRACRPGHDRAGGPGRPLLAAHESPDREDRGGTSRANDGPAARRARRRPSCL